MSSSSDRRESVPFVLRGRTPLPPQPEPGPHHRYDGQRQLWLSATSGDPLVLEYARRREGGPHADRSPYGETLLTKTQEGTDRTEVSGDSPFGETVSTRTSEGTDQREFAASDFGETLITETSEGTDQSESVRRSDFGETLATATQEGTDQRESQS